MVEKTNKGDKILSFSIFLFFLIQTINGSIKLLFDIPDNMYSVISNLFGIIYIIYFIAKVLPIILKRKPKALILSYFVFIVLYIISALLVHFRGEKIDWLISQGTIWTFAFWIPVGISVYSIIEYNTLYNTLLKHSYILTIIFTIVFVKSIIYVLAEQQAGFYNMFFSNILIIPTILHLSYYLESKNKILLLIFLFELTMILLIGSRGPFISVFSFLFIKFLMSNKSLVSKITTVVIIGIFAITIFSNLGKINSFIKDDLGLYSRTLSKASNKEMDLSEQLSGRDISWKAALILIEEKPFFGYGLKGDYYPMVKLTEALSFSGKGIDSAHNGFLELMMYFGIPIGLLSGIWLFFSIFKIRKNYSFQHRELLIILFAVFVLPALTVGGDIFAKPGIALYMYMIFRYHKKYYL